MLIWRGWGIVVVGIFFASVVFSMFMQGAMEGLLSQKHAMVMSFVLTGGLCWFIGASLANKARRNSRDMIDINTGEAVSIREYHDFFFVPVRFWAFPAWLMALVILVGGEGIDRVKARRDAEASQQAGMEQMVREAQELGAKEDAIWEAAMDAAEAKQRESAAATATAAVPVPPATSAQHAPPPPPAPQAPRPQTAVAEPLAPSLPRPGPSTVNEPERGGEARPVPAPAAAAPAPMPWPTPRHQTTVNGTVTQLDFSGNLEFADHDLARVAELRTLTHLDLSRTGITAAGLAHLANHPSLKSLRVDDCPVSGGLAPLGTIPSLVTLHAQGVNLADADLSAINAMGGLTELRLGENPITTAGLRSLNQLKNLRVIDLHGTRVDDGTLVHLQRLVTLTEIDLRDTAVGKPIVSRFAQLKPEVSLLHGSYEGPPQPVSATAAVSPPAPASPPASPANPTRPQIAPPSGSRTRSAAFDRELPSSDRMALMQAEGKMMRLTMDLTSYARSNLRFPDRLEQLDRTFLRDADMVDHWGDPYVYLGRGVSHESRLSGGERKIVLATAKAHAGRRVVCFNDGRVETITEEEFATMTRR